jgi:dolichyl-phosphate-mannose--protein O-mannosyl transferase
MSTPVSEGAVPDPRATGWRRQDLLVMLVLTGVAAAMRLWRLDVPLTRYFDEQFYAPDACHYVTGLFAECGLQGGIVEVHPPLGKWLIGSGIDLFGYNAFGSRIIPALAGSALVAVTYIMARKLFERTWAGAVAGTFVALDFLLFVHSRMAMLDIFLALFVALSIMFLLFDRGVVPRRGFTRWRVLAGLACGAALATKWPAAPIIPVCLGFAMAWELRARRLAGDAKPHRALIKQSSVGLIVSFVGLPVAVYLLSYVGRLEGAVFAHPGDVTSWFSAFWEQQLLMWNHFRLPRALHSYTSFAWAWLLGRAAYPYYFNSTETTVGTILAAGSPAMWIPVIPATIHAVVTWVRKRDSTDPLVIALVCFFATYGMWLIPSILGYENFFVYYLIPSVPFMALLATGLMLRLGTLRWGKWINRVIVGSWVAMFIFAYPILTARQLSIRDWDRRVDMYDLCPVPPGILRFTLGQYMDNACDVARTGANR